MGQRKWIVWGLVVVIGSLFASCLEEYTGVYNPGITPAVVRIHGDSSLTMAVTRYGWIYASTFSSYSTGKCLLVSFEYDPSDEDNVNASEEGYYTVTVESKTAVDQSTASSPVTDTSTLLTYEQPIVYPMYTGDSVYCLKLDDYFFLPSVCLTTSSQTLTWEMTYDASQQPETVDGHSVYSLYLRVSASTEKDEDDDYVYLSDLQAYDLSDFMDDMGLSRSEDMYVRIHYVNWINASDSTQFTWDVSDPILVNGYEE